MSDDPVIIGCGSPKFCGSGKNKTRILHELGMRGYECKYVTEAEPHLLQSMDDVCFSIHIASIPNSDFLDGQGKLTVFALAEKMVDVALESLRYRRRVVLWGTYLFPYCYAALLAKSSIEREVGGGASLVVTPAGSDIWQIGPWQRYNVRRLLADPAVDARTTYTTSFRDEICDQYDCVADFTIIPPTVDFQRFRRKGRKHRTKVLKSLGMDSEAVVVVHHSNMRPIKDPIAIAEVVEMTAERVSRAVELLLVGPRPAVGDGASPWLRDLEIGTGVRVANNLMVTWTGLLANVEDYLSAADVAINCSRHDSFNISLLEAMASGLPCVTSEVVGIADSIEASGGGFLISMREGGDSDQYSEADTIPKRRVDVEEMSQALASLVESPQDRRQFGRDGRRFAREMYSTEAVMRQHESLLRNTEE